MKIARNVGVSGRHVEWYAPNPGSLSEGAAERSEAEGVYFGERNLSKILEFICAGVQIVGMEQPSDDTPSVSPSGCQLPQGGSRETSPTMPITRPLGVSSAGGCFWGSVWGYFFHSTGYLRNRGGGGRFSSPLRSSEDFGFYHSTDDTPSVTPIWACQLPQRGSRGWLVPFTRLLAKIRGYGRLSSPLRKGGFYSTYHAPSLRGVMDFAW